MMDSFMPCYKKLLKSAFGIVLFLLSNAAWCDGVSVNRTETRLSDEGYQLKADFEVNLNYSVQQALSHGVAIYFVSEFSLTRSRWYWFDEQIATSTQTTKLYYNVLTRQYRISRGALFQSFQTLDEALAVIQRQSSGIIAPQLLSVKGNYLASVRLHLDIEQLPKLLQVNALTSKDWDLNSDWYRWIIRPSDIAAHDHLPAEGGR
jgi:hypothetical protein